jgi:hypothetical protein
MEEISPGEYVGNETIGSERGILADDKVEGEDEGVLYLILIV